MCSLWQLLFVVARKNAVCLVVVVVVVSTAAAAVVVVVGAVAGSQLSVGLFVLTNSNLLLVLLLESQHCSNRIWFPNKIYTLTHHTHTLMHIETPKKTQWKWTLLCLLLCL